MGRHRYDGASHIDLHLDEVPKPGSRRARREAERQARVNVQTDHAGRADADTGEIPVIAQDTSRFAPNFTPAAPGAGTPAAPGAGMPVAPGADTPAIPAAFMAAPRSTVPYAERMNHLLVAQNAGEHQPRRGVTRHRKIWQAAGFASAGFLVVGLGLGFAVDPTHSTTLASQAQAATFGRAPEVVSALTPSSASTEAGSVTVTVTVDGKETEISAAIGQTLAEALEAGGIVLGEHDEVSLPLSSRVEGPTSVTIARVTVTSEVEDYEIEFETERQDDSSLKAGEERTETEGKNGEGQRVYDVRYRDGKEVSRTLALETVTTEPVNEVVRVGTGGQSTGGSSSAPAAPAANVAPGTARAIAADMVAARGWSASEFSCLDSLWQRESGWNHTAMNPSSGAYGIPQALPGSKMASAGADWQTNPATQISWGLSYISGRYGTPCGALNHSHAVGWY